MDCSKEAFLPEKEYYGAGPAEAMGSILFPKLMLCGFDFAAIVYQNQFNMKKSAMLWGVTLLMSAMLWTSCDKDDDDVVTSNNSMSGSQEVPAVTTTATGSINVTYNKKTKLLSYT